MSPEKMIELLLSGDSRGGSYSQVLYGAFLRGFPLDYLRKLLISDNDNAVQMGAYLVYELGWRVHSLVPEIAGLLNHKKPQVRFDAVYALRDCAWRNDGAALGKAFLLLGDPDSFVHRGVIMFVQMSEDWKLRIAIWNAARLRPGTVFETVIASNLLGYRNRIFDKAKLKELVTHEEPIVRRFGAGMAVRPRSIVDEDFLDIGATCNDEEGNRAVDRARDKAWHNGGMLASLYYREKPPAPTNEQVDLAVELHMSGKRTIEIAHLLRIDGSELSKALLSRKARDENAAISSG